MRRGVEVNYIEALNYINDKNKFGSRLGLDTIDRLLNLLGNPHMGMKYIHLAGTNGKGSTAAFVTNILKESDYKVGLFTSPYLERFNERISINGADIPDERLADITKRIKDKIQIMLEEGYEHPTTFEIVTTIAFVYFNEENVDYVVLEVGLGGRADSTNVIKDSLISIITTIDYDHMDVLGHTLGKIAYEKGGIIKGNGLVLSYTQEKEAIDVIKEISADKEAELIVCPMKSVEIVNLTKHGGVFNFKYNDKEFKNIEISLLGKHQTYNAALALTAVLILKEKGLVNATEDNIRDGLKNTKWPGRMEILKKAPTFMIDGAHNIQGIRSLVESLKGFEYNRLILGTAILKDKDVEHMVEMLTPMADEIIVTEVDMSRKMEAEDLERIINKYNKNTHIEKDNEKAIDKAYELADNDDLIVFAGSLYLIGNIRRILLNNY